MSFFNESFGSVLTPEYSKTLDEVERKEIEVQNNKIEVIRNKYAVDFDLHNDDISTIKFRPHAIDSIMGGVPKPLTIRQEETFNAYQEKLDLGKTLTEKQSVEYWKFFGIKHHSKCVLNEAAIKYIKKLYKEFKFKRTNELRNKYTDKGLAVEGDSIELVNTLYGYNLQKNTTRFENKWLSGEPDIINGDEVYDIKSSWDFTTFPMLDEEVENKTYYYQLQAYMDLLGFKKAKLIYVLSNTPEMLIEDEKRRTSWKLGMIDLPQDLEYEIERNLTYGDLTENNPYLRIKIFDVERDDKVIEQMHQMIDLAREYLVEIDNKLKQNFSLT